MKNIQNLNDIFLFSLRQKVNFGTEINYPPPYSLNPSHPFLFIDKTLQQSCTIGKKITMSIVGRIIKVFWPITLSLFSSYKRSYTYYTNIKTHVLNYSKTKDTIQFDFWRTSNLYYSTKFTKLFLEYDISKSQFRELLFHWLYNNNSVNMIIFEKDI